MRESFWGDVAWLWGTSWPRHILFLVVLLMAFGAIAQGWTEADNSIRMNRKLRRDERNP
jgi:hypothetical protein